jgi:hypothetical protein
MFTACIDHSMTNISFVCALRSIKRKEKKKKKKKSTIVSFTQREIVTRYYYHTAQGGFGFDTMSWEVILRNKTEGSSLYQQRQETKQLLTYLPSWMDGGLGLSFSPLSDSHLS